MSGYAQIQWHRIPRTSLFLPQCAAHRYLGKCRPDAWAQTSTSRTVKRGARPVKTLVVFRLVRALRLTQEAIVPLFVLARRLLQGWILSGTLGFQKATHKLGAHLLERSEHSDPRK